MFVSVRRLKGIEKRQNFQLSEHWSGISGQLNKNNPKDIHVNFFASLFSQLPSFILVLVSLLTLVFFVMFIRKFRGSAQGLALAIRGLEAKLGQHTGRDPRELDAIFAKQPL